MSQQPFSKLCQIQVNPRAVLEDSNSVRGFIRYMEPFLQPQSIQEHLPPSDVVGNIRFATFIFIRTKFPNLFGPTLSIGK